MTLAENRPSGIELSESAQADHARNLSLLPIFRDDPAAYQLALLLGEFPSEEELDNNFGAGTADEENMGLLQGLLSFFRRQ